MAPNRHDYLSARSRRGGISNPIRKAGSMGISTAMAGTWRSVTTQSVSTASMISAIRLWQSAHGIRLAELDIASFMGIFQRLRTADRPSRSATRDTDLWRAAFVGAWRGGSGSCRDDGEEPDRLGCVSRDRRRDYDTLTSRIWSRTIRLFSLGSVNGTHTAQWFYSSVSGASLQKTGILVVLPRDIPEFWGQKFDNRVPRDSGRVL